MISVGILLFTLAQTFHCEDEILLRFSAFIEEKQVHQTNYEVFNYFDADDNGCIDYNEMNSLLKKIGVSWKCRWVQTLINYFDVLEKDHCIDWNEFKYAMRQ